MIGQKLWWHIDLRTNNCRSFGRPLMGLLKEAGKNVDDDDEDSV